MYGPIGKITDGFSNLDFNFTAKCTVSCTIDTDDGFSVNHSSHALGMLVGVEMDV